MDVKNYLLRSYSKMKRFLSALLVCIMVAGLLPVSAMAAGAEGAAVTTARVDFTAQAEGAFLCAPQYGVEVESSLAESYGYSDSVASGVSALDVLVKAHEIVFGSDYTAEDKDAYLAVGSTGFVTTIFGQETSANGFTLNGGFPNDGTESSYGGYNGTTVTNQPVVDSDSLEFFVYQDTSGWSDMAAWFCTENAACNTINGKAGAEIELQLKGVSYMGAYLYRDANEMHASGAAIEGAQLAWVDVSTGSLTGISGAVTDVNGKVKLSLPKAAGNYYLTAYRDKEDGAPLIMSVVKAAVAADPGKYGGLVLSGLHNEQVKYLKLYSYNEGAKGSEDLLSTITTSGGAYTIPALDKGDYLVEGYDKNDDFNGSIVITVEPDKNNEYTINRYYEITTNSGWVKGTDYTLNVNIKDKNGKDRSAVLGTCTSFKGQSWERTSESCIFAIGDKVTATVTPDSSLHPSYKTTTVKKEPTGNSNLSISCPEFVTVTFTAPAGSVIDAGTLASYYVYSFEEPVAQSDTAEGVSVSYQLGKNAEYFYRVQNPDGVTYWNYSKWSEDTNVAVSAAALYIGSETFKKGTVIDNFSKNIYDRADIYLNINEAGFKTMAVGDTFELNSFRNWFAIESFYNKQVALPDMHYRVVDENGSPSDVVTITPDARNNNVAVMKANTTGTAIVLVSYDAMTFVNGMSNTSSKQFSAIWPECTGVFVVSVGPAGKDIETNMHMDRLDASVTDAQKVIDAEHDILFYLGTEGAEYSFKPEDGCTVSVARSTVTDKMNFSGFVTTDVAVAEDGTVTVSKLTTGRHIIKVEKNGSAEYQVVTARQVSYKLTDESGNELSAASQAAIKAGDRVNIQFSGLLNPKEKLSGAYNFNFKLHYRGEDGTYFDSNPGGSFGVYDFSGNPVRQRITITIPKYWTAESYTLEAGSLKQGGFAGVPSHRGITYAKGTDPKYDAPSVSGMLSRLPEVTINLAETEFIDAKLLFVDENGESVSRDNLEVCIKDAQGNKLSLAADSTFKCLEESYYYEIKASGYTYTEGSIDVSRDNKEFTIRINTAAAGTWDGLSYSEPEKDGEVYLIKTGSELAWFSKQLAEKSINSFSARLENDINLGNYPWTAIHDGQVVMDGCGHEISGLNGSKGLFGKLKGESHIKNLTVSGVVKGSEVQIGGIVAYLYSGTVENCVNDVNVTSTGNKDKTGGIAGDMDSGAEIINCINRGVISSSGSQTGGIAGASYDNNTRIAGCYNTGAITGTSQVGGILGGTNYKTEVVNCYNLGSVSGNSNVGGVTGNLGGKAKACYNAGTVTGGNGFAGYAASAEKCYALTEDDYATVLTEAELKYAELGDGYVFVCNGYPALAWQQGVTTHTPSENPVVLAPTCTERGYTTYTCTSCHEEYITDYLPAAGHSEGEDLQVFPAYITYTCTTCGEPIVEWTDDRLEHLTLPEANASDISMSDSTQYPWVWNAEASSLESSNVKKGSTKSETSISFTLSKSGNLKFNYSVSSEARYDKLTISLGDETLVNAISGSETGSIDKALEAGSYTLTLSYSKDSSGDSGDDKGSISAFVLTVDSEPEIPQPPAEAKEIKVKFRLIGSTLANPEVDLSKGEDGYNGAEYVTWIKTTNYTLDKDATVGDLFRIALDEAGLDYVGLEDNYISSITAPSVSGGYVLEEKSNGGNSGWMYTVNGRHPNLGLNDWVLQDRDSVVWHYVNDFSYEIEDWMGTQEGDGSLHNKWLEAADIKPQANSTAESGQASGELSAKPSDVVITPSTALKDNKASASVSEKELTDAIISAKNNRADSIVIIPENTGNAELVEVSLPAAAASKLAEDARIALSINTGKACVEIPAETLASIASQAAAESLTVIVESRDAAEVGTALQGEAYLCVEVTIKSGDKSIAGFGGRSINITIPVTKNYVAGEDYMIVEISEDGSREILTGRCSGDDEKVVSVKTTHLSYFLVTTIKTRLPFADVADSAYYKNAVAWALDKGITAGTGSGSFSPDAPCTRAQMAAFLWIAAGKPEPQSSTCGFSDLKSSDYYYKPVLWMVEKGLTSGVSSSSFGADGLCTRAQMATFLYLFSGAEGGIRKDNPFADVKDGAYYYNAVLWAAEQGITSGTGKTSFSPDAVCTRAQMVTFLFNCLGK